ncbi:MAG TPA: endonuclease/exonuclease/phosphatase family protein [Chitinophagales bacterium]|nr:endonuclease/exonuclease/phosphatase family protein [Chitinophagales bacterium]
MSFLKKIFAFTNVLAALSLVAGGWSIYLNPAEWWFLSFFGLMYLLFLTINVFFLFFWIVVRLKYTLISLVAIVVTLPVLKTYCSFNPESRETSKSPSGITVMSYNVRNFDVYRWSKESNALKGILEMIKREHPDIVCLQEFYDADTGKFKTIALLAEAGLPNYYFEKKSVKKGRSWGTAIFSRYAIINHGNVEFDNQTQNSCSYADVKIDSVIVRVFNIHLQSVYLSKKDHEYLNDITENQDVQVKPAKEIFSKLKKAFIYRGEQALDIEKQISASPYPVIACGDFNDAPASFAYHTLSNHLQDAFLETGWGIAPTYSGFPKIYRIDYIFADSRFNITSYKTICEDHSDHYPVVSVMSLK